MQLSTQNHYPSSELTSSLIHYVIKPPQDGHRSFRVLFISFRVATPLLRVSGHFLDRRHIGDGRPESLNYDSTAGLKSALSLATWRRKI
ncbi:hypothetical protein JTE90_002980 [Oedothorax gibbosus]|uniref:Uncharacterized protein n=1 Tax=Oedothorax gibbosus TaxID=931172 RepID=A0AAV6VGA7_9ARAC|nr:hypothetical protein JTE90_002980 [Oedothorax gibbosus]